ncbi:MAG: HipA domain-containing protein [Opitutales bacterium]
MEDSVPAGFSGRLIAKRFSEWFEIDSNLERWSSDERMISLAALQWRAQGAWYVEGNNFQIPSEYSGSILRFGDLELVKAAENLASQATMLFGSSAGGDQPKIIAGDKIVKFSGPLDTTNGRRWGDLLILESLALETLRNLGFAIAVPEIKELGNRIFLESNRFDRTGELTRLGRHAVVSLRSVDAAFLGSPQRNWEDSGKGLLKMNLILEEDLNLISRLRRFGAAIQNNDMHFGNYSFFLKPEFPLIPAPVYDMLPMIYAPTRQGDMAMEMIPVKETDLTIDPLIREGVAHFWTEASNHPGVSDSMSKIATSHLDSI